MKIGDAAQILSHMYDTAPANEKVVMIHLFAIKYADQIKSMSPKELVIRAGLRESYATEIRKCINLAKYVEPKER